MMRQENSTPLYARLTVHVLWTIAMLLIAATSLTCALCAYQSLSDLINGNWYAAGGWTGLSGVTAVASFLLCQYRGDLVGDSNDI